MIDNFYKMNNPVFPDSSLRPGLVDKRHSIYPVGLAFHIKNIDGLSFYKPNIFLECPAKHPRVSTGDFLLC